MKVAIQNVYTTVTECSDAEFDFLMDSLEITVPNHEHTTVFKKGLWDGKKSFFSQAYRKFPSGFLPFLLEESKKEKIKIFGVDERVVIPTKDTASFAQRYPKLAARDYQIEAMQKIFSSALRFENCVIPWQRGVVKLPTGGGKTAVSGCIIDFVGKRSLFVVERKNLAHQTAKELQAVTKMKVGILGDGKAEYADVTVGIIQTLRRQLKNPAFQRYLKTIDLIVIDECHHVSKGAYHELLLKCPAYFRYGLSATPGMRGDLGDLYLVGDVGSTLVDTPRKELEEQGFLATPKVFMFSVKEPNGVGMSYRSAYQELIVENAVRNGMIVSAVKKLRARGCRILILVSILDHGKNIQKLLKKAGIQSTYLHGKNTSDERQAAIDAMKTGVDVIVASRIFDEGVNLLEVNAGILAGAGSSSIKSIQRVGRMVRPKAGSNTCFIVDFIDKNNQYLLKHSAIRVSVYEQEGFKIDYPASV